MKEITATTQRTELVETTGTNLLQHTINPKPKQISLLRAFFSAPTIPVDLHPDKTMLKKAKFTLHLINGAEINAPLN